MRKYRELTPRTRLNPQSNASRKELLTNNSSLYPYKKIHLKNMITQKHNSAINTISQLLFPPKCIGCGKLGESICKRCIKTFLTNFPQECAVCRKLSNNFKTHPKCLSKIEIKKVYISWYYNKFAKKLMKKFKYNYRYRIIETVIPHAVERFKNIFKTNTILVPVPSHCNRLKERGFNQAEIIASKVALLTKSKCVKVLEKHKDTGHQALKSREKRIRNEINPYRVIEDKKDLIGGADVILVDDVCTTGTTLKLCAQTLLPCKPCSIRAFTLFRGRRPRKTSSK